MKTENLKFNRVNKFVVLAQGEHTERLFGEIVKVSDKPTQFEARCAGHSTVTKTQKEARQFLTDLYNS